MSEEIQEPGGAPLTPPPNKPVLPKVVLMVALAFVPVALASWGIARSLETSYIPLTSWFILGFAALLNVAWSYGISTFKESRKERIIITVALTPLACIVTAGLAVPGCLVCLVTMKQLT